MSTTEQQTNRDDILGQFYVNILEIDITRTFSFSVIRVLGEHKDFTSITKKFKYIMIKFDGL